MMQRIRQDDCDTPYTKQEAHALLNNVPNKRDRALVALGIGTGIKITDLDQITPQTLSYAEHSLSVWDEGFRRIRNVYLPNTVLDILKDYQNGSEIRGLLIMPSETARRRILEITQDGLGTRRTWTALRRTFVHMAQDVLPMQQLVENTGEHPDTIYAAFSRKIRDYGSLADILQ